ncbi:MAG: DHH family phosphoesterase [Verrucomicrobiae bacterium]|nr:DHH family phosphoesterase [Verrucomicrobiae bacterium]
MKLVHLEVNGSKPRDLLEAVCRARGCETLEEIEQFLHDLPLFSNSIAQLSDYSKAEERLLRALKNQERTVIFGDYDADGITALVQMHDLLRTANHEAFDWFIPDRMEDDYGLTQGAVEKCLAAFKPQLIITVDCGSSSQAAIRFLHEHGVDCIVIDHHLVEFTLEKHPAYAHLNPKAYALENSAIALTELSAAGLVFLFCEKFVQSTGIQNWNRDRALILAGLGTIVDVMPLRRINRALAKHSLQRANQSEILEKIPGLLALKQVANTDRVTVQTYSFQWGPRLNATGRLEEASCSVQLLLAKNIKEAMSLAQKCDDYNRERQAMQRKMESSAFQQAQSLLEKNPNDIVLLLADKEWHPGVVGIVASRVKERWGRPAILCGWHESAGYWKGSGRSLEPYDLGAGIKQAVEAGLLLKGGGHRAAAGLTLKAEQLEIFRRWLNDNCLHALKDFQLEHEILAKVEGSLTPNALELARKWHALLSRLEPFGMGNPLPHLLLSSAELRWGPEPKLARETRKVWAYRAGFSWSGQGLLFVDWPDPERAANEWKKGDSYNLVVHVNTYQSMNELVYGWRVKDCSKAG